MSDRYLHTPDFEEKKGRTEDGPIGIKPQFVSWPEHGSPKGGKSKVAKASAPKAVAPVSGSTKGSGGVGPSTGGKK